MVCNIPSVVSVLGRLIDFGNHALLADQLCPLEFGTMLSVAMLYYDLCKDISFKSARFAKRDLSMERNHYTHSNNFRITYLGK